MKLSVFAKKQGVTYRTAWRWYKEGKIIGAYKIGDSIFVEDKLSTPDKTEYVIIYARVSSHENKDNLDAQAQRLQQFCAAKGWIVQENVKEIASGLNDSRAKLQKILKEKKVTKLVVEHKDRLTRFGFKYLETLLDPCEIVVINREEGKTPDLLEDFVSLVTSFCARIYGCRRNKRRTEKLIQELANG
jgi:putative resolvase